MARSNRSAGSKLRKNIKVSGNRQGSAVKAETKAGADAGVPEWDEAEDMQELIPDIDIMLGKPVKSPAYDASVRARIEMLREERMLREAITDTFDF